jgi:hypothetical protein
MTPESYSWPTSALSHNRQISRGPSITIEPNELDGLNRFIREFEPKVPESAMWGKTVDPLEIALRRYLDSIKGALVAEDQLLRAVMGLEALYLTDNSEMKFKLALRVSQFMGLMGANAFDASQVVSRAYRYRSSFVHGSVWTDAHRKDAEEALKLVWRYLRLSLLYWLVERISSDQKKEEFLKEIDASLIDDATRNGLRGKVESAKAIMQPST